MIYLSIWLYICCVVACGASYWKHTASRRSIKISGAIAVGLIGPPLLPIFIFLHVLEFMRETKHGASPFSSTESKRHGS